MNVHSNNFSSPYQHSEESSPHNRNMGNRRNTSPWPNGHEQWMSAHRPGEDSLALKSLKKIIMNEILIDHENK